MKRIALVFIIAGAAVALAAWQLAPAGGPRPTIAPAPMAQTAIAPAQNTAPAASAGYVVHLDENGNVVEQATPEMQAEFNAGLNELINTSSEGLVERASTVPGGGIGIDLQGRFQSAATAAVNASGKLTVPCLSNENDVRAFTSDAANDAAPAKE